MSISKKIQELPADYAVFLKTIKQRIHASRIQAHRAVNKELIDLYWNIGRDIAFRQERDGWGKSVIEKIIARLARGISRRFRLLYTKSLVYAAVLS